MKASVKIPVIANGDIISFEKAHEVMAYTKTDGVMIGRGAMGNPWIFRQLKEGKAFLSRSEKRDVILEHFDNMIEFHGEYGAVLFRKHLHNYSKGYGGVDIPGYDQPNRRCGRSAQNDRGVLRIKGAQ